MGPDLLQMESELDELQMAGEEGSQIKLMKKVLYDSFRSYDKLDSGVITLEDFNLVLSLVNINLNED